MKSGKVKEKDRERRERENEESKRARKWYRIIFNTNF